MLILCGDDGIDGRESNGREGERQRELERQMERASDSGEALLLDVLLRRSRGGNVAPLLGHQETVQNPMHYKGNI